MRWIRDTPYAAIYKNLLDTYCKEFAPATTAITLFYQLPQDGTTYMRNPKPFNTDAHIAELYAVRGWGSGAEDWSKSRWNCKRLRGWVAA